MTLTIYSRYSALVVEHSYERLKTLLISPELIPINECGTDKAVSRKGLARTESHVDKELQSRFDRLSLQLNCVAKLFPQSSDAENARAGVEGLNTKRKRASTISTMLFTLGFGV